MVRCERCGQETAMYCISRFDMKRICFGCDARERKHPKYRQAIEAERQACKRGEPAFQGIGLPEDL